MRVSILVFFISVLVAVAFIVIGLNATTNTATAAGSPRVTLSISPTRTSHNIARDHTVGQINLRSGGDERYFNLAWNTENVNDSTCKSTGFDHTKARNGRKNLSWNQLTPPRSGDSKTFIMTCTGTNGETVSDSITLTMSDLDPFVALEWVVFRPAPFGQTSEHWTSWEKRWSTGNVTIKAASRVRGAQWEELYIRWRAYGADNCTGSISGNTDKSGTSFDTGGKTVGRGYVFPITGNGEWREYTITCTSPSGDTATDSFIVTGSTDNGWHGPRGPVNHPGTSAYSTTVAEEPQDGPSGTDSAPTPTATLERKHKGVWGTGDLTISGTERVDLRWKSTDTIRCSGSGPGFSTGDKTSGNDWFIDEPTVGNSSTYGVVCLGSDGTSAEDSITITNQPTAPGALEIPVPTATLEVKQGEFLYSGNLTIESDEQVELVWSSTNADSCFGSGPGFSASDPSGTDNDITEPTPGNSSTYTITCAGPGGIAMAALTITIGEAVSIPTLEKSPPTVSMMVAVYVGSNYLQDWGTEDISILPGEQVALLWQSTDATNCSTSNGFTIPADEVTYGIDWYVTEPATGNSTTYTATCTGPGGTTTDSITVTATAIPNFFGIDTNSIESSAPPPRVLMKVATYQGANYLQYWGTEDITIMPGNQVALSWQSADATNCSAGDNSFTVPPDKITFGYDWYVIEPRPGSSRTYTIICTGSGGTAMDSITVTNLALTIPTIGY